MDTSKYLIYNSSESRAKFPVKVFKRLSKLSKPKSRNEDEDLVGPGRYYPKDSFLSTKSKSPQPAMCKSTRFANQKLPPVYLTNTKSSHCYTETNRTALSNSPSFSFKRTGHNLQLVENPSFPGAGQYSPIQSLAKKHCSFSKAPRNFNWKKVSLDKLQFKKIESILDGNY